MKSEQINELATALAKAQSEIVSAPRDAENPYFKSSYATLDSVWNVARTPLTKNGLSLIQTTGYHVETFGLITMLMHSSGQWISSFYELKPIKNDPQGMGSAMSYARRYSLSALVGIPQADDDAQLASHTVAKPVQSQGVTNGQPQRSNPISNPKVGTGGIVEKASPGNIERRIGSAVEQMQNLAKSNQQTGRPPQTQKVPQVTEKQLGNLHRTNQDPRNNEIPPGLFDDGEPLPF